MLESILTLTVIVSGLICALSALSLVAGSLVYNVHGSSWKKQQHKHPNSRIYRHRPLVTVLVSTRNNGSDISSCLESLIKGSYRKLEVIVIDNNSADGTKEVVRDIIKSYPNRSVKLIARRRSDFSYRDIRMAYQRYGHGEVVAVIDADSILEKRALINAVNRFNTDTLCDLIIPKQRIDKTMTTIGLLNRYSDIFDARLKQFRSVSGGFSSSGTKAIVGRHQALLSLFKQNNDSLIDLDIFLKTLRFNPDIKCRYAADVLVEYRHAALTPRPLRRQYKLLNNTKNVPAKSNVYSSLNKFIKLRMLGSRLTNYILSAAALLGSLIIVYFAYLAISLHEPALLIASLITFSLFLISAIWDDQNSSALQKVSYLLLLPVSYLWFYISSLYLPLAILWSVFEN